MFGGVPGFLWDLYSTENNHKPWRVRQLLITSCTVLVMMSSWNYSGLLDTQIPTDVVDIV